MHKGNKPFVVVMAILIMVFASCATKPTETKPETVPEVTTTTVAAPIPEVVPAVTVTTVAVEPTTVVQPSVSEIELRNLFGQANSLKMDVARYDIPRVLPDAFKTVDDDFAAIKTAYDSTMDEVSYDGVKAYPIKARLEKSIASWESLIAEGMPLRVEEESDKTTDMKFAAISAEAPELASERFQGSEELLSEADALAEGKEYSMAIPAYQQTAAGFDVAAEKAKANKIREKIFANGYAKYADSNFQIAENKYKAEEELWTSGSLEDLKAGAQTLREANDYYEFVAATGAEYKSFEGKDSALQAQEKALSIKADVNAPEQYSSANDILSEAMANQEKGDYESAYLWFGDATEAYGGAYDAAMSLQSENEGAIATAEAAVLASEQKSDASGIEGNVYLPEAKSYLENAKAQSEEMLFADSTVNANEAVNYAVMSDNYIDSEQKKAAEAEAKALQDAKALTDPAMADARTRMAWAENNEIKADYPEQYKQADAAMKAAEMAYANEKYVPAKDLAGEVSTTLSDDFQKQVLADRDAAAAEKASIEAEKARLAAEKAEADPAMADARTRMAWAENNEIKADYPEQYKQSDAAMKAAEMAYANEKYVPAKDLAGEVSTTLSDDFQKQVLADRDAAAAEKASIEAEKARIEAERARLAAEKVATDSAMADAQNRMAWANENGIKEEYPNEYQGASKAMVDAFVSYGKEDYDTATGKAKEVSSILSDDFQNAVMAEKKAAEEEKARLAAEKAEADPAMADARTRMAWAENNEIKADYPAQYKQADAAMKAAEMAYANEKYVPAKDLAGEVSTTLSDDFQKQVLADREAAAAKKAKDAEAAKAAAIAAAKAAALTDIENAQGKYDWSVSKNAQNNYPELLAKGAIELDSAKVAFNAEDYANASAKARAASETFSGIAEFAPLPATYVVRLIPERRDCLWRIAEYPFIYNNPLKWPVLYEANKKTFRDPSNPNLIFPNQVLQIPSIKGETRSGTWDPKKSYNPLPRK